ncbi:MAG: guanylate kinase [Parasporobacterium sp.]|nr:guanylate kinase [Parasporobacterium sp.]
MGKIYFLMGKSASGKDTIYAKILSDPSLSLKPYVGYTTRPKRAGETEGVEYHFTTEQDLKAFEASGRLIEKRVYHTIYGDWYYYSVDDENTDLDSYDYLYIGTLESYVQMRDYYGEDKLVPIYIEVEDGLRLLRAIEREQKQKDPGYAEVCRRFLGDCADFSEENLKAAGIEKRYDNTDLKTCLDEIYQTVFGRESSPDSLHKDSFL